MHWRGAEEGCAGVQLLPHLAQWRVDGAFGKPPGKMEGRPPRQLGQKTKAFRMTQEDQNASVAGKVAVLTAAAEPNLPAWLRELYPFVTRTAILGSDANARRMSFVELGSPLAPPVVLLHGNPTWSFLWRSLLPRLAERYRVIAPDWIGFGLSDKPTDAAYHSMAQHSADLAALLAALEAENSAFRAQKIMLVMHDWGGPIGLDYAARHPQRIRKLVLANSWLTPSPVAGQIRLKPAQRLGIGGPLARWMDGALNLAIPAVVSSTGTQALPANVVDAYKFPFEAKQSKPRTAPRAFFLMTDACEKGWCGNGRPAEQSEISNPFNVVGLTAVSAPAEILWGGKDALSGKLAAMTLHRGLPGAREPLCLDYHGHMLPEETPEALLTRIYEEPAKPQPVLRILL